MDAHPWWCVLVATVVYKVQPAYHHRCCTEVTTKGVNNDGHYTRPGHCRRLDSYLHDILASLKPGVPFTSNWRVNSINSPMAIGTKRRRRGGSPSTAATLAPEEQFLKQFTLPKDGSGRWSWVGTEVATPDGITSSHQLAAYGFTSKSGYSACANKYPPCHAVTDTAGSSQPEEKEEEIIVISDDEVTPVCSKKNCKGNPRCLNYLGQDVWENPGEFAA